MVRALHGSLMVEMGTVRAAISECVDDNTAAAFVHGQLPVAARMRVEQHVDGCAMCRLVLSSLSDLDDDLSVKRETATPLRGDSNRLSEPTHPKGAVVANRYTLDVMLGRGGMGFVWAADDAKLERRVAIKLLSSNAGASTDSKRRFEREAKAIARLRSPHIVEIYDYGLEGDTPLIAMELLDGEDLSTRLRRVERLPAADVVQIVNDTARALSTAHAAGIIHRDLKPGNIFLCKHDGSELLKVFDFG